MAPDGCAHTPPVRRSQRVAMGHFYSGDVAGAAKILERVTATSPANANAWRMLALCYRTTGNLDGARGAYGKALALEPGARAR
jgi:Flp pilus assembly protein TadD